MKTKKTTLAAYLAGVTTLAVSLPAMADTPVKLDAKPGTGIEMPVGKDAEKS